MIQGLTESEIRQFCSLASAVLKSPQVQQLSEYRQHGRSTRLTHSIAVAWYSFAVYRRLGLRGQERQIIRGALLHDFCFYDWHDAGGRRLTGLTHPGEAARNAGAVFDLDAVERDIIRKHMWPLTVIPPAHRSALIVCFVDKACTCAESAGCSYRMVFRCCRSRIRFSTAL